MQDAKLEPREQALQDRVAELEGITNEALEIGEILTDNLTVPESEKLAVAVAKECFSKLRATLNKQEGE